MLEFRSLVEYVKLVFTIYRWPSRFWCVTRAHTSPKSVLGCLLKWTVRYITKHPTLYYGGTCLALFLWTVVLYQYSLLAHGRQPLTAVWIQWPVVFGIQGTLWVPWTLIVFSGYGSKQGNSEFRIVKYGDSYKLWHYFLQLCVTATSQRSIALSCWFPVRRNVSTYRICWQICPVILVTCQECSSYHFYWSSKVKSVYDKHTSQVITAVPGILILMLHRSRLDVGSAIVFGCLRYLLYKMTVLYCGRLTCNCWYWLACFPNIRLLYVSTLSMLNGA